jgi:excinuclease ABC subunit B
MVIMYADRVTDSMQRTIDETNRRRLIQEEYNLKHGITPTQIIRSTEQHLKKQVDYNDDLKLYDTDTVVGIAADPVVDYMSKSQLENSIKKLKKDMEKAAKKLDFIEAARLRDEMYILQQKLKKH